MVIQHQRLDTWLRFDWMCILTKSTISSKSLRSGIFKLPATVRRNEPDACQMAKATRDFKGLRNNNFWLYFTNAWQAKAPELLANIWQLLNLLLTCCSQAGDSTRFTLSYCVAALCELSGSGLPRPLITFFMVFKSSLIASGTKSGIRVQSLHRETHPTRFL